MKPILFNTQMVQAILEGRKTVTRRVIKQKYNNTHIEWKNDKFGQQIIELQNEEEGVTNIGGVQKVLGFRYIQPPYRKGDILYVRETWAKVKGESRYLYKADKVDFIYKELHSSWKWNPSIHMPKEAARIFLRVTNVLVAKLQDITENDAYREGVMKAHDPTFNTDYWYYKEGQNYSNGKCWAENARQCFLWGIWNGTLKKPKEYERYNQNRNPWVWVIEFERTEKPNEWI